MAKFTLAALLAITLNAPSFAHFVFIVPDADGATLRVVMSESLEPDEAVKLGPVAQLKLVSRSINGKEAALTLAPHEHHLSGTAPGRNVVFGSLDYGVTSRAGQTFLLKYHPKAVIGAVPVPRHRLGKLPAEIVSERTKDGVSFRVLSADSPAARVDVTVLLPDGNTKKVATDAEGRTPKFTAQGRYGAWARVVEEVAGDYNGQKYTQIRHYPTLVMDHTAYPPLPEAVSSFGAAVSDGWVYCYGGHRSKIHTYDTNAVTGGWRRLNLAQPKSWEELTPSTPLQGLALVVHNGRCIRIGGMLPKNAPGTKAEVFSTDTCEQFDATKNAWTPLPKLPKPRSSHDAVVVGNTLVVIGGWTMNGAAGNEWLDDALILDLQNPQSGWKSIPQPIRRRALQTGVHQNRVYAVGGLNEDDSVTNEVSIFDPATKVWSTGPELPGSERAAFNPGICTLNGRLFVGTGDGTIARLSADGKSWEPVAKVAPRVVHRMVAVGTDTILVIGGAHAGENLDSVEAVRIPG